MTRGRVAIAVAVLTMLAGLPSRADLMATGFEPPVFTPGSVHGQDGWRSPGPYDEGIIPNRNNFPGFGFQSLRLSNAVVSGNLGDQTISKPTLNETGESDAVNGGHSGGTRVRRFDAQWAFGSTSNLWQPGLSIGIAPERGDGSPMSVLRIDDQIDGMDFVFVEYRSGSHQPGCSPRNLNIVTIAQNVGRFQTHRVRLVLDFLEGTRNDVVRVYIDDALRHTGTTWEDFYRECFGPGSRTVDSLNFHATGTQCTACNGQGFVFDNLETRALGAVVTPTSLTVAEGGPPAVYSVRLETPPLDFVRIIPQPGAGITVSPPERVFTPANFNIPQTFTVTAVDDSTPEAPATVFIEHSVASFDGHWDGSPVDRVTVTVNDNDPPFIVTETDGTTVVSEQGPTTDFYSIRLFTQPTANVTITATPDAQVTVTPASRVFTPANWNIPQTWTVTAVDDAIDEPDSHTGLITHASASTDPAYDGQPVPSITATVFDNDPLPPPVPAPVITNCPGAPIEQRIYTLRGTTQINTAIEVYINGNVAGGVLPDIFGNWVIDITFPGNGTFTVTARATDLQGNRSPFSAPCFVTVNADLTPPPVPTIITPAEGAITPPTVTVSGNAFGDTVEVRLFDAGIQIATMAVTAGPWSTTQTFTSRVHTLTVRALDAAGNISAPSPVRTFTADGNPPVITIDTAPFTIFFQLVLPFQPWMIQGTATDALSGVTRMEVRFDNLFTGETATEPITCACPSAPGALILWEHHPSLVPGFYRMTVRGFDRIGNMGQAVRTVLFVA